MKKAIIFGITGQDGSYLAELLLKNEYEVIGVKLLKTMNQMKFIIWLPSLMWPPVSSSPILLAILHLVEC